MAHSNDAVSTEIGRRNPVSSDIPAQLAALADLDKARLRSEWRRLYRAAPPRLLSRDLLIRGVAYKLQERAWGGLRKRTLRKLKALARRLDSESVGVIDPRRSLKCGARLVREWGGETHSVLALEEGFEYRGEHYRSLSEIARLITGAHWSGPRFFALARASKPFSHE
jgi:hypothetical protein